MGKTGPPFRNIFLPAALRLCFMRPASELHRPRER